MIRLYKVSGDGPARSSLSNSAKLNLGARRVAPFAQRDAQFLDRRGRAFHLPGGNGEATFAAIVEDLATAYSTPRDRIVGNVTALLRGLADKRRLEL